MRLLIAVAAALAGCSADMAAPPRPPSEPARSVRYTCAGGEVLSVDFSGGAAVLTSADGLSLSLRQQPSGSGFRYASGGTVIRGKGTELQWTRAGQTIWCKEAAPDRVSLAGTRWQLVHFQSSDDSIGMVVPPDPTRYTVEFGSDGRASFRLDCNRVNATWSQGPGNQFRFGPGAMTRAACPAGSLDTRIAGDLSRVRSAIIEGDTINFSLEADGGVYRWRRLP
jgi:heat shock protein HslJ